MTVELTGSVPKYWRFDRSGCMHPHVEPAVELRVHSVANVLVAFTGAEPPVVGIGAGLAGGVDRLVEWCCRDQCRTSPSSGAVHTASVAVGESSGGRVNAGGLHSCLVGPGKLPVSPCALHAEFPQLHPPGWRPHPAPRGLQRCVGGHWSLVSSLELRNDLDQILSQTQDPVQDMLGMNGAFMPSVH
jgi:hypothetical protein